MVLSTSDAGRDVGGQGGKEDSGQDGGSGQQQQQQQPHPFSTLFSLADKVVVVTGGSRGLGYAAAEGFLQAGAAKVYITARKAAACDAAAAALNRLASAAGVAGRAISVPADLSRIDGVQQLVQAVRRTTAHVDVLLANAGTTWGEVFDTHADAAFGKVLDLNVRSVFGTIRLFTPLLEKRATVDDPSRVVITASTAGLTASNWGTYGYAASKAAVIHLTKVLALELGPRHILCNALAPGFVPSKMADGLIAALGGAAAVAARNPSGRIGRGEDVAAAAVFLCARAGSHINGAVLPIDGGSHLGVPVAATATTAAAAAPAPAPAPAPAKTVAAAPRSKL